MRRPDVRDCGARLDRVRRRFGLDRNDLRRPIDRRQWLKGLLLAMVFVLTAPPVSAWAARNGYDAGLRAQRHEITTRHQVTATLVAVDRSRVASGGDAARARWTERDGTGREAEITVFRAARVGAEHRIWVDGSGKVASAPRKYSSVIGDAVAAGVGAAAGIGAALLLVHMLLRRRFDRRCYRMWDAAWADLHARRVT